MTKRIRTFGTSILLLMGALTYNLIRNHDELFAFVSTSSFQFSKNASIGHLNTGVDMCAVFGQIDLSSDTSEGRRNLLDVPGTMRKNPAPFVDRLCRDSFGLYYTDEYSEETTEFLSDGFRHEARPLLLGTEHCEKMRNVHGVNLRVAIAGMFNTGTNAFVRNLQANIGVAGHENDATVQSPESSRLPKEINLNGIDFQVPWWKHHPDIANTSLPLHRDPTKHSHILPIVMVRDPLNWMQSTCINRYDLSWHLDSKRQNLGNSVPGPQNANMYQTRRSCPKMGSLDSFTNETITTPVRFNLHEIFFGSQSDTTPIWRDDQNVTPQSHGPPKIRQYKSLLHLWNDFYRQYYDADFPRLFVRFEDTIFLLPRVLETIKQCVNGYSKTNTTKQYLTNSKSHGGRTNLWSALRKNSDKNTRLQIVSSPSEREFVRSEIDSTLMKAFHYHMP
ncbi:hypothetical protein IV203_022345 [Nitzschia inconspicua]|uniref:Sulfotransferase domain-containing protein n=1 Tax=Nitzschia inconspicua TaxID=303405 RepID=A0A9K3PE28_9STRA|nr:hypothetical protein IV203_022345 [Nitzschia inconspicua]